MATPGLQHARLPELASKLERLDCSAICLTPNTGASFQLITRRVSDDTELLRFTSLRWPEIAIKQASVTTLHVSVAWVFLQKLIKLPFINSESSVAFSVIVLLLKCKFFLRCILQCLSSKDSLGWEFVYHALHVFLSESSKTLHYCC